MKTKESLVATILTPFFTILLVLIFLVGSILLYINDNIFNTKKLVENIKVEELIEEVKEEVIDVSIANQAYDQYDLEEIIDVVFEKEFVNLALAEVWDAEFYGDSQIDRKAMEKAFDNASKDYFKEHSDEFSSKDVKYLKEELLDFFETAVYDTAKTAAYSEERELVSKAKDYSAKIISLLLLLSVVLIVILVLLYKNKARVIGFTGIAMTISQTITLLIAGGFTALFSAFIKDVPAEEAEDVAEFVLSSFNNLSRNAFILFGGLLVLGIVFIILGKVLSKSYNETEDIEDFDTLSDFD